MNPLQPRGCRCRADSNPIRPGGALLLSLALIALTAVGPARGELNKDEQAKVNQAIDKGVEYLKQQQLPVGTWPAPDDKHPIGYAALPGLTLLESGVPANDPAVKRVAALIRQHYGRLDQTYEIALCILFLDRLGNPDDKKIIQTLALRLVAGQKYTGGWHYKCPLLTQAIERELLTTLQALPALPPLIADQTGKLDTGVEGIPVTVAMPLLGTFSYKASPDQIPAGAVTNSTSSSRGDPDGVADMSPSLAMAASHLSSQNRCIKALEPAPTPSDPARTAKDKKPARPVAIPANLQRMPIFIDARKKLVMVEDPQHKTDNSNTQFAILALWAAQRYDVPVDRTLRLLVRRFQVTQNANGGWDYWFFLGGGDNQAERGPGPTPQMAAVGLLGLAVGHGLAAPARGADHRGRPKDPTILKGFVALTTAIGQPTGRMQGIPQSPSLYFLWSLERVAVLYNLPTIGDKEWYRWGAEILVANQQPAGNWEKGKYPGESPVIDTCLALLFLQRANLAKDLAERLPFNPADLNAAVTDQARKDAPKPGDTGLIEDRTPATAPEPSPPMVVPPVTTEQKDEAAEKPEETKAERVQKDEPSRTASGPAAQPEEKRKIWPYILLGVGAVMLLGFGVFLAIYLRGGGEQEDADEKVDNRPRKKLARRTARR
jgi:hypothetical protein